MKGFLKFVGIFAFILLAAAFLSPILYDFLPFKFERIFNRIVMIGTLLAIVIFVRVKKESLIRFGLMWRKESAGYLAAGLLTGILALALAEVVRVTLGHAVWAPKDLSWLSWTGKFAAAIGTGLLIGVIEEFFFRGFIFRSLLRILKDRAVLSILITSVFYSIIHFIGMKKIFVGSDPSFVDGLRLIGAPFVSLGKWPQFWPAAVGLFLFGLALNAAAIKSGSLYPCIGLHAGCVMFIRVDDLFLKFQGPKSFFWGSKIIYDGIVGWGFLVLIGVVLWFLLKRSPDTTKE